MSDTKITEIILAQETFRRGRQVALGKKVPLGHIEICDDGKKYLVLTVMPINARMDRMLCHPVDEPLPDKVWDPLKPVAGDEDGEF